MGPNYEFLGLSVGYIQKGMTAIAQPAAKEFFEFYGLPTVPIPPYQPCLRIDYPDLIFTHRQAKLKALIKEVKGSKAKGRPALIGTATLEESEDIASALRSNGIERQFLNATNDEQEASIKDVLLKREITPRVQRIIEGRNFDIRKKLWKYFVLLEEQRKIVQQRRRLILKNEYSSKINQNKISKGCPEAANYSCHQKVTFDTHSLPPIINSFSG
ncbi:MAG: hypothetical protein B5M54_02695 [Candidatus Aminicenantes bacterium 4484_214]|nr:MAG: hypothetical protein B5M54_02695 [Candidatus Aminicenantes bacterium 4484_214]